MKLSEISPQPGERGALIGKTRQGKSTLARALLAHVAVHQPIIVIDPKGEWEGPPGAVYIDAPARLSSSYIVYQPDLLSPIVEDLDRILTACFRAGDCCIYIDEVYGCREPGTNRFPTTLEALYTRGGSRRITVLASIQRPTNVPVPTWSECEHWYAFALESKSDRERMADLIGDQCKTLPPKYHFWYTGRNTGICPDRPLILPSNV